MIYEHLEHSYLDLVKLEKAGEIELYYHGTTVYYTVEHLTPKFIRIKSGDQQYVIHKA